MEEKKNKPVIGFAGLLLLAAGFCAFSLGGKGFAMALLAIGAIVLGYALFTGNLKLFG